jgi:hypothetical protein
MVWINTGLGPPKKLERLWNLVILDDKDEVARRADLVDFRIG